jgi:hypothetical protein
MVHFLGTCFEYPGTFVELFSLRFVDCGCEAFRIPNLVLEYLHWIGIGNIARIPIPAKAILNVGRRYCLYILYRYLRFVLPHATQLVQERRPIKAPVRTVLVVFSMVKWEFNIV